MHQHRRGDLLRAEERLLLLNHSINYCQTAILHVQTEMDRLGYELADQPISAFLENLLRVMKHIVQQWQAESDWVTSVREQALDQTSTTT